jgi:hypothetical protein
MKQTTSHKTHPSYSASSRRIFTTEKRERREKKEEEGKKCVFLSCSFFSLLSLFSVVKILLFSFLPMSAYALYMGNPDSPEIPDEGMFSLKETIFDVKVGYQGEYCVDRKLAHVQQFSQTAQAGAVTLNFFNRCELYGVCGSSQIDVTQTPQNGFLLEYETDPRFFWEAGGKMVLIYWGDSRIGVDAKWMQSTGDLRWVTLNQETLPEGNASLSYREWQVGLGISHRIERLIPYLGVTYSAARARLQHLDSLAFLFPDGHVAMKERQPFSLVVGCGISAQRALEMNIEIRMIGESAGSIAANLQF